MTSKKSWVSKDNPVKFHCTKCGDCCYEIDWRDGETVFVTPEDAERIAKRLDIPIEVFKTMYAVETLNSDMVLRANLEHPRKPCVFLNTEDDTCTIYPDWPTQCGTFPFWPSLIDGDDSDYKFYGEDICEGLNHEDAKNIPEEEMLLKLNAARKVRTTEGKGKL